MSRAGFWCGLGFALGFPTLIGWWYFVLMASPDQAAPGFGTLTAYAIGKSIQFLFPLVWIYHFDRQRLQAARPHFAGLAPGLIFGLVVCLGLFVLYFGMLRGTSMLAKTPAKVVEKIREAHADTPLRYVLMSFFIAVIHSLFEEYYWRWFVFAALRQRLSVAWAIPVSSLGFMAHHVIVLAVYLPGRFWTLAVPLSLGVAVGGAVWCWLYQRTGTIYSSWVSHALIDLGILVVGYDMAFVIGR